jgi:carbonic anhydrase
MSLGTLLDRNKAFAATDAVAKNPKIPWIPHQLSYVITCIDSRVEPAAILGVDLGDATVQRVVGGRVTPAVLRDVAYISYLTETKTPDGPWWELAVIHHTDCGSTLLADPELRRGFAARGGYVEAGSAAARPAGVSDFPVRTGPIAEIHVGQCRTMQSRAPV